MSKSHGSDSSIVAMLIFDSENFTVIIRRIFLFLENNSEIFGGGRCMIHTVEGFSIVNKAEIDVLLELLLFR